MLRMAAKKEATAKATTAKNADQKSTTASKKSTTPKKSTESKKSDELMTTDTSVQEKTIKVPETSNEVKKEKKKPGRKPGTKMVQAKLTAEVHVQFAGKSYSQEQLTDIAKNVWQFDLGKDPEDLKSIEVYVKPEESMAFYVCNGEEKGSFLL
jgi:hypothetical protein